jgi:hypothetical protein
MVSSSAYGISLSTELGPLQLTTNERYRMLLRAMVLIGKERKKEEHLPVLRKDGGVATFASKSEARRAAFQQFGDDLNVEMEELHGPPAIRSTENTGDGATHQDDVPSADSKGSL